MQNEKQKEHTCDSAVICAWFAYYTLLPPLNTHTTARAYITRQFVKTAEPKERIKMYGIKMKWDREKKRRNYNKYVAEE